MLSVCVRSNSLRRLRQQKTEELAQLQSVLAAEEAVQRGDASGEIGEIDIRTIPEIKNEIERVQRIIASCNAEITRLMCRYHAETKNVGPVSDSTCSI
jgi:hypothetical protein